jgi:hypothetical protein
MDVFEWSTLLAEIFPDSWLSTRGQLVKIALIDTGVNFDVHSLAHLDKVGRKFYIGKTGFTVFDKLGKDPVADGQIPGGHGTRLAGILAGKADPNNQDQLNGLANQADLFVIKAREPLSTGGDYSTFKSLLYGLELAASLGVDIAVTAQVFNLTEKTLPPAEVDRVLKAVESSGMQVFCAVENRAPGENWTGLAQNYFPGEVPFFTKIAAAPADIAQARPQIVGQKIQFLPAGFPVKTYGTGNRLISPRFSNSLATTVVGGAAALCMSFLKSSGQAADRNAVLKQLADRCQPLASADGVYAKPVIFKNF